jgi:AcrR family transcriptional regulator
MPRGLTTKGAATKQRIIEAAAHLMRDRGPSAVSLEDVLRATATGKSQLFHYFPEGRQDLLLAVARYEAEQELAAQEPYLSRLTSWSDWLAWRDALISHYTRLGMACPLSAVTAQLGKSSPQSREIVSDLYQTWEKRLLAGVRALAEEHELPDGLDPPRAARAILAAIQGGILILQVTGDVSYLASGLDIALAPLASIQALPAPSVYAS